MPLVEVACPGCQTTLKAPDSMAGKKARCKRCNTPFRIPGGSAADSVGDSQMLSVADPPPAAPAVRRPTPGPKAAAVEEEDIPAASAVDDDEPLSAAVAEDEPPPAPAADPFAFSDTPAGKKKPRPARDADDEPAPAAPAAAGGDPFSFDASAEPAAKSGAKSGVRKKPAPRDDDADDDRPAGKGAKKPAGGGGLIKVAVAAAVFALVGGGVVAGVLVYLNATKTGEQAKNDNKKKDEKVEPAPADPNPPPKDAGKGDANPQQKDKDSGKATKGTGGASPKTPKGKSGGMLSLPAGKVFAFPAKPAAPKGVTEPTNSPPEIAIPFAEVRRFFAPAKTDADIGVAWRSHAGFQGAGEKITVSLFSPRGTEIAKVETDGDGSAEPACDLSVDGATFAYGNRITGRVTVWDVKKKAKKLDAFDPYKDLPDHKAVKLAAVFLTEPPDRLVTVTTAGAVHVWEVGTKAMAGEYAPPKAAPNKVSPGRGVAAYPNRQGVVVAVGGTVYKVDTAGTVAGGAAEDLGGDVGRSLALAVSPGGKVLYAFETDADGKKERAVMMLAEGARSPAFRWPADQGEPVSAGWCGDTVAALGTSQGAAVWFDTDGGFNPIAVARTPEDKAAHAATDTHWTLLPAAGNPKGCIAVELTLPPQGVGDPLTPAARRPTASLVLDAKGLSQ